MKWSLLGRRCQRTVRMYTIQPQNDISHDCNAPCIWFPFLHHCIAHMIYLYSGLREMSAFNPSAYTVALLGCCHGCSVVCSAEKQERFDLSELTHNTILLFDFEKSLYAPCADLEMPASPPLACFEL